MQNSFPRSPKAVNEPVRPYPPGSDDAKAVLKSV